jgi:elongator complex protein 3
MVVEGTELERWQQTGRYVPYDNETMIDLICRIKALVPPYVRISRVLRDIPARFIVGGLKDSLRGPVRELMQRQQAECRCVRCREYGHRQRQGREIGEPGLVRRDYTAAGGTEVFLSFEDAGETLFGMLRLRIQPDWPAGLAGLTGRAALVRELHVYGPEVPLSQRDEGTVQHRGIGRALLEEAERIAAGEFQTGWLAVLSGTGAREYYRSEGYTPQGHYMVRPLQA